MKLRIKYISCFLALFWASTYSYAQNWQLKANADFNFYFTDSLNKLLPVYDSIFKLELAKLQKQLNYHANQPIDIFITDKISIANDLNQGSQIEVQGSGGIINMELTPVVLITTMGYNESKIVFRKAAASLLLDEMMNGGTLQDKVRNANLIHLPDWVLPGLVHYLSDEWSTETDNTWRMLHDELGLNRFNAIPANQVHIKGAAMWKYITYKYGDNAIQTILYMARLTRKFNAALFYAYQVSMSEIYRGALNFYETGYQIDQQKPNPINGITYNADKLLDIYIKNQSTYYTLEQKSLGMALYVVNAQTNEKEKLYVLANNELTHSPFSGSIQVQGKDVYVYISTKDGVIQRSSKDNFASYKPIGISTISQCKQVAETTYFLQSNLLVSKLFLWNGKSLSALWAYDGWVESFDINKNKLVYIKRAGINATIGIHNLSNGNKQEVEFKNEQIKQVIWANDSILLFNSNHNGIWNGRLYNVNTGALSSVTNYRSNIGYHYYSKEVFAEFLSIGKYSSLYLAEYIPTSEFYTYDSIESAYFSKVLVLASEGESKNTKTKVDSLSNYTFQSPVNFNFDFTLSNYDSLSKVEANKNRLLDGNVLAPNVFKPSKLVVKLNNGLLINNQTAFLNQIPTLTPNHITIGLATLFKNQFSNQELAVFYNGFIQQGAQDIGLIYSKRNLWQSQLTALHRQRVLFKNESRLRYSTDVVSYSLTKKVSNPVLFYVNPIIRWDRNSTLAIDKESLDAPDVHKVFSSLALGFKTNFSNNRSLFQAKLNVAPQIAFIPNGFNTTLNLAVNYKYQPLYWLSIEALGLAGTSVGNLPNVFSLGGVQNDVLSNYYERPIGNNVQTSLIHLVYGLRGFDVNYRNGTTFGLINVEMPLNLLDLAFRRPITSEVFSNIAFIPFFDMATSYYGKNIYDTKNNLNRGIISSSTGTIIAEVNAFKNPFVYATGVGLSTQVYNYKIRFDYALGMEEGKVASSMLHFTFGFAL